MKKIAIVWGITVLMVFGALTYFGFKYQEIKVYKKLETKMEYYAKKYIEEESNFKLNKTEKYKITLEEIKTFRPKINFDIKNDSCDGYVIISKNIFGYNYKATLKCDNY